MAGIHSSPDTGIKHLILHGVVVRWKAQRPEPQAGQSRSLHPLHTQLFTISSFTTDQLVRSMSTNRSRSASDAAPSGLAQAVSIAL